VAAVMAARWASSESRIMVRRRVRRARGGTLGRALGSGCSGRAPRGGGARCGAKWTRTVRRGHGPSRCRAGASALRCPCAGDDAHSD
jgi:hypothetical protein